MKADVKSEKSRRIRYFVLLPFYLPFRFLRSCQLVIWAFCLKPYPSAFEEFGIRVVALEDDGTWINHIKVYTALELLNRYDKEKFELVIKHIRIIYIRPMENNGSRWKQSNVCRYMGTGVCVLNLQRVLAEKPLGQRASSIIWSLVYEASRVKFAGEFGTYLRTSEAIKNLCREEGQRTMQKFCE